MYCQPMLPLAPALFMTMTPLGKCFCEALPKARARASVPPPAWNGTTSSMGTVGVTAGMGEGRQHGGGGRGEDRGE